MGQNFIKVRSKSGASIADSIRDMIKVSNYTGFLVELTHNGIKIIIGHDSNLLLKIAEWERKYERKAK